MIYFDIETEALPEEQIWHLMPEFTAPSNYKDAEKIAANIAEQKAKWLDSAALSPLTGRVLAIGFRDPSKGTLGTCIWGKEPSEEFLIRTFAGHLDMQANCGQTMISGWNIKGFDIPFLIKRGWKYGIHFPQWMTDKAPFGLEPPVLDLMQVFQAGDYRAGYTALDTAAKFLGLDGKLGSGKDFAKLYHSDRPAALAYLSRDVELLEQIHNRIKQP